MKMSKQSIRNVLMNHFNFKICSILLILIAYSSAIQSNTFLMQSYTGVINVQKSYLTKPTHGIRTRSIPDIYLLYTSNEKKPFKLVFKEGQPDHTLLTGDKVEVIGLNAADKLFVQKIESIRNNALPF